MLLSVTASVLFFMLHFYSSPLEMFLSYTGIMTPYMLLTSGVDPNPVNDAEKFALLLIPSKGINNSTVPDFFDRVSFSYASNFLTVSLEPSSNSIRPAKRIVYPAPGKTTFSISTGYVSVSSFISGKKYSRGYFIPDNYFVLPNRETLK
jgi:hypothetical protein